jgi:hypothetical protein
MLEVYLLFTGINPSDSEMYGSGFISSKFIIIVLMYFIDIGSLMISKYYKQVLSIERII